VFHEILGQHQVLAVGAPAADDDVGVRVVGVVVIDREPLQLGPDRRARARHHLACVGWQVGEPGAVLRAQHDAEMALVRARPGLGASRAVRAVALGVVEDRSLGLAPRQIFGVRFGLALGVAPRIRKFRVLVAAMLAQVVAGRSVARHVGRVRLQTGAAASGVVEVMHLDYDALACVEAVRRGRQRFSDAVAALERGALVQHARQFLATGASAAA
jgi:hypothetical protein